MEYKKEFIEFMVRSGALAFGDFTTKSGRKTPYFVNTGNYKTGGQMRLLGHYYAACIMDHIKAGKINAGFSALFGPAYKGIPLAVTTAIALSADFDKDVNFCFNRKESKDHGEGGSMVGYSLKDGDTILMVEDVITAGTAVRETLPILKSQADVTVCGLMISVDRMEKGKGDRTAIQEIREEFGIETISIVTIQEVINELYQKEIDGKILIDDQMRERMENYLRQYGG